MKPQVITVRDKRGREKKVIDLGLSKEDSDAIRQQALEDCRRTRGLNYISALMGRMHS